MPLDALRRANPGLEIFDIEDPEFAAYGTPFTGTWSGMVEALERFAPIPDEGVSYVPSCPPLEACPAGEVLLAAAYGGLPAQVGYCTGRNFRLNGLEFHRASEILVAGSDLTLLLGLRSDLEQGAPGPGYDSSKAVAFLVRKGRAVELFSGTLHLAPCQIRSGGFRAAIVLPRGTNEDFPPGTRPEGDALLRKRNKWILAHPDRRVLVDQGVIPGIRGKNIEIYPVEAS